MTGRSRASRPGCSSQPTTPLEAAVRAPVRQQQQNQQVWELPKAGAGLCMGRAEPGVS